MLPSLKLDTQKFWEHFHAMITFLVTLLDPLILVVMLGLAAIFRGSFRSIIFAAVGFAALAFVLKQPQGPFVQFAIAGMWGLIGLAIFKKRSGQMIGNDIAEDDLNSDIVK